MTKRGRTILFLIFLFLFLLIVPLVIFYSQGYRIDFENKKITQTGGLFLKIWPKQVEVYLDGKLKKRTDFFFGSVLIENLLPKKYQIKIVKEGYHSWEKTLEIKEKEVTEAKNIVLFPKNPDFAILAKGIDNLWFSPDEKKIIFSEVNEQGLWALKLYDLEKNIKSHLVAEGDIYSKTQAERRVEMKANPKGQTSSTGADLMNLKFSEDSKEIYLDVAIKEQEKNFSLKLDKFPPVLTEKALSREMLPENIVTSKKINNDLYRLDNFGHFFRNGEKLTEKSFPIQVETEYTLEIFQNFIFLREDQILYLFNPDSKSFEKFFEPIKSIKISPDSKKLFYFSDSEIWVLFLKDGPPGHRAGDRVFLIRLSEKIGDCFWLNSSYLIFNAANKIKIAEIDDRDRINIIDLAEFKEPKIFFNQADKKLYILREGNLSVSEKLF